MKLFEQGLFSSTVSVRENEENELYIVYTALFRDCKLDTFHNLEDLIDYLDLKDVIVWSNYDDEFKCMDPDLEPFVFKVHHGYSIECQPHIQLLHKGNIVKIFETLESALKFAKGNEVDCD